MIAAAAAARTQTGAETIHEGDGSTYKSVCAQMNASQCGADKQDKECIYFWKEKPTNLNFEPKNNDDVHLMGTTLTPILTG